MTDLEISKALALAIGWDKSRMTVFQDGVPPGCEYLVVRPDGFKHGRPFSYMDWNVIAPIAEVYKCFPQFLNIKSLWWVSEVQNEDWVDVEADTPQKAIALAVIGATK